jgi:hypothetical protein
MHARTFRRVDHADGALTIGHPDTALRADGRRVLWDWCATHSFDLRAIGTVDATIWINMAPLYDRVLGDYLYAFGRLLLELRHRNGVDPVSEAALIPQLGETPATGA